MDTNQVRKESAQLLVRLAHFRKSLKSNQRDYMKELERLKRKLMS